MITVLLPTKIVLNNFMKMAKKIEHFISVVKQYPILYDMTLPDFKDTKKKDFIWGNDVSFQMNGESGDVLKSKWKNLRDTYQKHLRANKMTTAELCLYETKNKNLATYKKWQWAPHMEYLKEHLNFTETITNVHEPAQDENDDSNDLLIISTEPTFKKNEVVFPASPKHLHQNFRDLSQTDIEKNPQCANVDKVLEHSEKKRKTPHNNVLDGIELLMMGHAKTIKTFSAKRQAIAKHKIAKLIGELELEQYGTNGTSNMTSVTPNAVDY